MKHFLTILFCLPLFVFAQKTHTVGPKESLTSIGRLYNINGRELANYNNIDYEKGLSLGQVLKIPSTVKAATPEIKSPVVKAEVVVEKPEVKNTSTAGTPIYHTVAPKETLYGISVKYGKVSIADLKKWNNLTSDGLSEGAKIIVGYTDAKTTTASTVVKEVKKADPVEEIKVPVIKEAPIVVKEDKKEIPTPTTIVHTGKDFNGGFFKSIYTTQTKNSDLTTESGTAGVFKSTSGWEDGKYYCLHNAATAGTIVKISNSVTGKTIYAKVLDVIPDIKQNTGVLVRLSNAAAEELGVSDTKFDCSVSYSK